VIRYHWNIVIQQQTSRMHRYMMLDSSPEVCTFLTNMRSLSFKLMQESLKIIREKLWKDSEERKEKWYWEILVESIKTVLFYNLMYIFHALRKILTQRLLNMDNIWKSIRFKYIFACILITFVTSCIISISPINIG